MRSILILTLIATAAPAFAGTRAVYRMDDGKQLAIEVTDAGEARVQETGSGDYGVLRADGFYMVGDEGGATRVARIEDVATAIDHVVPPLFKGMLADPAAMPSARLRIEPGTETSVGGVRGRRYTVYGLDEQDATKGETYVVATDPKLAPVGKAMEAFMNSAMVPVAVLIGPAVADIIGQTRAIFALGTPIEAGGRFKLESVAAADVPASRTALPGTPQSVAEIETLLRQSIARTPAPPPH